MAAGGVCWTGGSAGLVWLGVPVGGVCGAWVAGGWGGWPVSLVGAAAGGDVVEVGVVEGVGVAAGCVDGQPEQVGQAACVAAGGVGLVEDAVLADRGGGQWRADRQPYPVGTDWFGAVRSAER